MPVLMLSEPSSSPGVAMQGFLDFKEKYSEKRGKDYEL